MFFKGRHACKSPVPFDATTFDLRSNEISQMFNGVFEITIKAVVVDERENAGAKTEYRDTKKSRVRITVVIDPSKPSIVLPLEFPSTFVEQVNFILVLFYIVLM